MRLKFLRLNKWNISTPLLKLLLILHIVPINQVIYLESYPLDGVRSLILGHASRLDAFSAYHYQT